MDRAIPSSSAEGPQARPLAQERPGVSCSWVPIPGSDPSRGRDLSGPSFTGHGRALAAERNAGSQAGLRVGDCKDCSPQAPDVSRRVNDCEQTKVAAQPLSFLAPDRQPRRHLWRNPPTSWPVLRADCTGPYKPLDGISLARARGTTERAAGPCESVARWGRRSVLRAVSDGLMRAAGTASRSLGAFRAGRAQRPSDGPLVGPARASARRARRALRRAHPPGQSRGADRHHREQSVGLARRSRERFAIERGARAKCQRHAR